jgi:hypothetical protein
MKFNKLGFIGKVVCTTLAICGLAGAAENWGYLQSDTFVEGKGNNNTIWTVKDDEVHSGTTNNFDQGKDQELSVDLIQPNSGGSFTEVENRKIMSEYSPNDSNYPKYICAFFKGPINTGEDPNVTLEFSLLYGGNFGGRRLIFTEIYNDLNNQNPNNRQIDLQQNITGSTDGVARIVYGKLPAGNYTPDTPFLGLRLDFGKLLADFNGDDIVNLKDYAVLANDWGQTGSNLQGDISGPNDLPDIKVDNYDLAKFIEYWLETAPEN